MDLLNDPEIKNIIETAQDEAGNFFKLALRAWFRDKLFFTGLLLLWSFPCIVCLGVIGRIRPGLNTTPDKSPFIYTMQ
jgi:hypothetical protein